MRWEAIMNGRPIAVVYLRDTAQARQVAQLLEAADLQVHVAPGCDDFYQLLNHERVDLVIIEHRLPGFFTGLEILERLYGDLLRPPTMLVGNLTPTEARRASDLGIDLVVGDHSRLSQLVADARVVMANSRHTMVDVPSEARRLVQQADCIRPLPQLLVRLSQFLNDEVASLEELARDISVDPRVTAELLRLTNSSALGRTYKTTNVVEAVKYLGVRRTVGLVLSAGMFRAQSGLMSSLPPWISQWYHGRSVLTASTSAAFAATLEQLSPDTAFILGLLQDVGILVLAGVYGHRYTQLLQRTREIAALRLERIEEFEFGLTHADVSAALLLKWDIPVSLATMVLNHHRPQRLKERSTIEQGFARCMLIAEALANLLDNRGAPRVHGLNALLADYGPDRVRFCRAALRDSVARTLESSRIFNVPVPAEPVLQALVARMAEVGSAHAGAEVRQGTVATSSAHPEAATGSAPASVPPRHQAMGSSPASALADSARTAPTPAAATRPAVSPADVLILTDEKHLAAAARRLFISTGLSVASCNNEAEMHAHLVGARLLLCDRDLRSGNCLQIVQRVRERSFAGRILLLCDSDDASTATQMLNAGVDDVVYKPLSLQGLLEPLQRCGLIDATRRVAETATVP
jgi:HD-like signal output (HDOD) protein/FixJ family two-component response regulator